MKYAVMYNYKPGEEGVGIGVTLDQAKIIAMDLIINTVASDLKGHSIRVIKHPNSTGVSFNVVAHDKYYFIDIEEMS